MDQNEGSGNVPSVDISTPTEKMIPQSEVNKIVQHVKYDTAEKVKAQTLAEMKRNQAESSVNITPEQIQTIVQDTLNQRDKLQYEHTQNANAERVVYEFMSKLQNAKDIYPDFQETISQLPMASISNVVGLANEFPNTAHIMYELAKNPSKLVTFTSLANINSDYAFKKMKSLSDSININSESKNAKIPSAPLNQLNSSPVKMDNGSMSVAAFRKMFTR
jgi:hypothetical protein